MSGSNIDITDWRRILFGEVPASFYVETVFRAAFVYLVLMVSLRLLGRRMASQLNLMEIAALVSLAAAVGIPMLSPDSGLLVAVVIAIVIVGIGRLSASWSMRNPKMETIIAGRVKPLVEDSVLLLRPMKDVRITRERLFAHLRGQGIHQLGKVRRVYFEAGGTFSVVEAPDPKPGLSVIPDWDKEFVQEQKAVEGVLVCSLCGKEQKHGERECPNCGSDRWVAAIE
jgi:uncharacterized membrane protein YcaP (DUF421 family)